MHCVLLCIGKNIIFSQGKPRTARQLRQQHLPSVLHRLRTLVLHPLLFLCPLSRSAGRLSHSPRARTANYQLHRCLQLPRRWRVNLPSSPLAGLQTPLSLLPQPPQLVLLRASNCSPLPPNQAKATPSSCPRLDEYKNLMSSKRDPLFLLRLPPSNHLESGVQAKTPPNLLPLPLWCAALCRTCHWTTLLCAGWPSRRPLLHLLSTSGPEAGLGQPACLLPPFTPLERKMMRKKMSRD